MDTSIASRAWFGALNEVILQWLIKGEPERLEDAYDSLRPLLMRSVGVYSHGCIRSGWLEGWDDLRGDGSDGHTLRRQRAEAGPRAKAPSGGAARPLSKRRAW